MPTGIIHNTKREKSEAHVQEKAKDRAAGDSEHSSSKSLAGSSRGAKKAHKKGSPTKSWKKPPDMPKRPLSAYNLFFQAERRSMVGGNGPGAGPQVGTDEAKKVFDSKPTKRKHVKDSGVGFANLAKSVAAKWKDLSDQERAPFVHQSERERERYEIEMAKWRLKEAQRKRTETPTVGLGTTDRNHPLIVGMPEDSSLQQAGTVSYPTEWFHTSFNSLSESTRTYGTYLSGGTTLESSERSAASATALFATMQMSPALPGPVSPWSPNQQSTQQVPNYCFPPYNRSSRMQQVAPPPLFQTEFQIQDTIWRRSIGIPSDYPSNFRPNIASSNYSKHPSYVMLNTADYEHNSRGHVYAEHQATDSRMENAYNIPGHMTASLPYHISPTALHQQTTQRERAAFAPFGAAARDGPYAESVHAGIFDASTTYPTLTAAPTFDHVVQTMPSEESFGAGCMPSLDHNVNSMPSQDSHDAHHLLDDDMIAYLTDFDFPPPGKG